ncbi:unnamed protein product, partial [marine sediment metagenome]
DKNFERQLKMLKEFGFRGVEVNIAKPDQIDANDLRQYFSDFNLRFTMFASGLAAKTFDLSLSNEDPGIRARSVQKCIDFIDFAEKFDAGVIVGFLKGGIARDAHHAGKLFTDSLSRIAPHALQKSVPVLIEATNRYESSVAKSLEETVDLVKEYQNSFIRILPDTFHMNIEEADQSAALRKYIKYYDSIHISDNNRYFPGLGAINFAEIIRFLRGLQYQGGIAIEGNIKKSFIDDLRKSMDYLIPLLS